MASKLSTREGNIREFVLSQAKNKGISIDLTEIIVDIKYYENVLSNAISLTIIIAETGGSDVGSVGNRGILDGLPVRGGEPCDIVIEDHDGNVFKFKDENKLYVNRVRNAIPGTQKDVYAIDFTSRECFANEQCRVVRRYEGKISDNVKDILKKSISKDAGIKTEKEVDVDETLIPYNFIGNDKKPFYICTWLASKSIPMLEGKQGLGGAAGYLFYETHDGFKFKSIDVLFDEKKNEPKGKYIFTNTPDNPSDGVYDGKVLSYDIVKNIDLQNNLSMGNYSNRTIFFDFYMNNYKVRKFNVDDKAPSTDNQGGSKGKINTLGDEDIDSVADEFRLPPSRFMNRVLDVGTLPAGRSTKEQLEKWKENPDVPTYDATQTMVQSLMRYNQMFAIKINITIAGDFSLRAGDLVYFDFPQLTVDPDTEVNEQSGGLYMISSLCHNLTPEETYTSLTLVRDTFGRKPY